MNSMTPSSFGEMLKAFRKRKHFTQERLASKLGVHRNTIGTWERGAFLPDSKGVVLELARLVHLDDQETRQLLEASLTALVPYWNIPYPRNPFFTGREEVLDTLHQHLSPDQAIALTQSHAVSGLGGIGKTQLVVEYGYRHALEYNAVFWVGAETVEHIIAGFLRMAELLQLPERQQADQQRIVAAVQRWLCTHGEWLLIWDNLEELELLQRFLPPTHQGVILITTQCQALGTLALSLELQAMEPEEGMALLLRRAKVLSQEATSEQMHQLAMSRLTEYAAAQELVTVLGGLPLALDQAGAYIEETGCSLMDYLQRYEQQRAQVLQRRGMLPGDHPQSVMTTFRLATQRMERDSPAAAALLCVCAFLHAEVIPEEIFLAEASHLGPALTPLAADPFQLDLAFAALRTFSLVQRIPEMQAISVHRLVQAVLRESMSELHQTQWQQHTIRMLNAAFPEVAHEVWRQCERLLPHVLTCASFIPDQTGDQNLAEVLCKAADYLHERGQYEQAKPLYQRALGIREQMSGPEHIQMAVPLNGLAILYYEQGKYEQAEPLYKRALRIREQALGPDHSDVAYPLNGLALLYTRQGKYEQAEPLYQRALRIREQTLGPDHSLMAAPLHNLAILYYEQGKYEQAEPLYQRAVRVSEQTLGSQHPNTAVFLQGLAIIYCEQGKYEQAEPLFQQGLGISEQVLGPDHPQIAIGLNNLADLYSEQEKYEQAEPLFQQALRIWEQALGPDHPQIAIGLNNLADLYREQEKYEQTESLYQRALTIREQHLGQNHPDTARSLASLAMLYKKLGQEDQARSLLQRACTIFDQRLGQTHPETMKALNDYHSLFEQKRRTTEVLCEEQSEHALPAQGSSHQNGINDSV